MTANQVRRTLLGKELRLALQPPAVIFMAMALMLLIPEYPYLITFFYTTLSVFFICIFGRENHDVEYTALLPVDRRSIVRARFDLCVGLELIMLAISALVAAARPAMGLLTNAAGMVPNAAFFGFAFLLLGIFNVIFFPLYYKNTKKIGVPYTIAAVAYSVGMIAIMVGTMIPGSPLAGLDGYDPADAGARTAMLLIGAGIFALLTWLAYAASVRRFEKEDI